MQRRALPHQTENPVLLPLSSVEKSETSTLLPTAQETSYFVVRLAQNSYQAVTNGVSSLLNWGKDLYNLQTRKDEFIVSELYERARHSNITSLTTAPSSLAWITGGRLPHQMYVITGPRINVQKVADYGEFNKDPAARSMLNFVDQLIGRTTLATQLGAPVKAEKGLLKNHLNNLQVAANVSRTLYKKLIANWDTDLSYQDQITYLGANILGKCIWGIPELDMKYIPELREVGHVLLDSSQNAQRIKKSTEFVTRMNVELLNNRNLNIVSSIAEPTEDGNEAKFIADDLAQSIDNGETAPDIRKNPEALAQRLLERRGISMYIVESNLSSAIMFGIAYLSEHPDIKQRLIQELTENQITLGDEETPLNELRELPYLDAIYYETLRLSSTAPLLARKTSMASTMEIKDEQGVKRQYNIPAHSLLFIPLRSMHHDPRIWGDNPLQFDPSRFEVDTQKVPESKPESTPELIHEAKMRAAKSRRDRVLSFSTGQRQCPAGQNGFVESVVKSIWAECVLNHEFQFNKEFETVPTHQAETYWKDDYFASVSSTRAPSAAMSRR